jgi:transglutaminase-like putative cysteine protease
MRMRTPASSFLCAAVWLGAGFLGLASVAAAKEHAPQWALEAAQTPTPPHAGNASAVVLSDAYVITVDRDNHAVEQERYAVRILQPEGRSYADCEAEYDTDEKLDSFRSWTITPGGRQLQAMKTDFSDLGVYDAPILQFTARVRTLNPPGDDPGSVVVCETERHLPPYMNSETWQIQQSIPVVDESLDLVLPAGGHFSQSWSRHAPVEPVEAGPDHLRWEIRNMPALDLENLHATPPWDALAARMDVMWGSTTIQGAANQWRAIGEWQEQLETGRADPTPEITAAAQQLVAGAPDFYTKLSRITQYIQKNIRYFIIERGIGGFQPHYASEIFRNRYGDCKDKTTLLIAMLKAVGIRAYSLSVDSQRGVVNPAAPSLLANHMVAAIEMPEGENDPRLMARVKAVSGKTLLIFDPTDEETPVGLIRGQLQGAYGYLADGDDSQVLEMPVLPPDSAGIDRTGSFVLSADGSLSGSDTSVYTGNSAAGERYFLRETAPKDVRQELETSLSADLPGLTLKDYAFQQASSLNQPLTLSLHLGAANYAHNAGPLILVRPRVFGSDTRTVPDAAQTAKYSYPIEIGYPGRWRTSFDITLPPGYAAIDTPDPVNIDVGFASYRSSTTIKGNVLHYEREYVVRQVEIPDSKAAGLRKLEAAIVEDEQGVAVLRKQ